MNQNSDQQYPDSSNSNSNETGQKLNGVNGDDSNQNFSSDSAPMQ